MAYKKSSKNVLNIDRGEDLIAAFVFAARTPELLKAFLLDLLTERELARCINRYYIASRLGEVSYRYFTGWDGTSHMTVSKLAKQLKDINGGFSQLFQKMKDLGLEAGPEEEELRKIWAMKPDPSEILETAALLSMNELL